ncbi:MAG TPA: hypothetical protein VIY48_17770, partial [Candidatus Paceibacterota bacterium]
ARENQSELVRKAMNVLLFSRSFNVGNVGQVKDTVFGLPAGLAAKIYADVGKESGDKAMKAAKAKARMAVAVDFGMSMLLISAASAAIQTMLKDESVDDVEKGYLRRLSAMFDTVKAHPLNPASYNPYQVLPTWDNEPNKEDRIDIGEDETGRHEYMRLPTGKVVEDIVGWTLHSPDTFVKKMSPMAKATWQALANDKGYGVPVEDPDGNTLQHIAQGVEHVIKAQVPYDTMQTLYDVTSGHGTELDKHKLAGFATGFSTSQGNVHGPEAGVMAATEERVKQAKLYASEEVKTLLKRGYEDEARDRLEKAGLTPAEINKLIRFYESPKGGVSKQQARKFNQHATDEERAKLEVMRGK